MEIKGKLLEIFDEAQISDRFRKREFVVEHAENPQYPEYIKFECVQDKCNMLDNLSVGQEINISFNLKGRKWTDPRGEVKYFNTLQAWRIESVDNHPDSGTIPPQTQQQNPPEESGLFSAEEDSDDLPF